MATWEKNILQSLWHQGQDEFPHAFVSSIGLGMSAPIIKDKPGWGSTLYVPSSRANQNAKCCRASPIMPREELVWSGSSAMLNCTQGNQVHY